MPPRPQLGAGRPAEESAGSGDEDAHAATVTAQAGAAEGRPVCDAAPMRSEAASEATAPTG